MSSGLHGTSLAARFRIADANIRAARDSLFVTLQTFSTEWDRTLLQRSMAYAILSASNFVRRLDRSDQFFLCIPPHEMQASAAALLL